MPDSPLERAGDDPCDRGMEQWVSRLEETMRDNTAAIARIDVAVAEMRDVLPLLATKAEIGQLATKAEIKQLATKAEVGQLATKAEVASLATKAELAQQIAPLATKAELTQHIASLATKAELAQQIAPLPTKAELAQQIAPPATKAELAQQIAQLATKAELTQQISLVATKVEVAELRVDIAKLSTRIEHEMATKADIAVLRGYVMGLPTTWVMVTAIVAGQIGISGVIAGALLAAARMFLHN